MGQDDHRPAAGRRRDVGHEGARGGLVEVLRRLVEDEDPDVGEEGAGERQPLALAAGQPRAVLAHRAWRGRRGAIPTQSRSWASARAPRSSSSDAPGRARRRLSAIVASKTWGSCSHRPTTRLTSSPARVRSSVAPASPTSSSVPAAGSRKRRHAAANVLLPAPLGPVTRTLPPAGTSRSRAARASRRRPRVAERRGRGPEGPAGRRHHRRRGGVRDRVGAVQHLDDAAGRRRQAGQLARGRDEGRDHLVDGDRGQDDDGEEDPGEGAVADRDDPEEERQPRRGAGGQAGDQAADAGTRGHAPLGRGQPRVDPLDVGDRPRCGAAREQLRRAAQEVHGGVGERPARGGDGALRSPGDSRGGERRTRPRRPRSPHPGRRRRRAPATRPGARRRRRRARPRGTAGGRAATGRRARRRRRRAGPGGRRPGARPGRPGRGGPGGRRRPPAAPRGSGTRRRARPVARRSGGRRG